MRLFVYTALLLGLLMSPFSFADTESDNSQVMAKYGKPGDKYDVAIFAGGCFWCLEEDFEKLKGVYVAEPGYINASMQATYEQISSGQTVGYMGVRVFYNPDILPYEKLVDYYWRFVDPTDIGGSFTERGRQYSSVIFFRDGAQMSQARESKERLNALNLYGGSTIITEIRPVNTFVVAETFHQSFYKNYPIRYRAYRYDLGRDQFLDKIWRDRVIKEGSNQTAKIYYRPNDSLIRSSLTDLQYQVTQKGATEESYREGSYWNENRDGIYVDVVSSEPLFASVDKFDAGTGYPSFKKPIDPQYIMTKKVGFIIFGRKVAVHSRYGDSYLGELFDDGPAPTGLRYSINSAALNFIPKDQMRAQGYANYLYLFTQ